jgi:hypothetical protein
MHSPTRAGCWDMRSSRGLQSPSPQRATARSLSSWSLQDLDNRELFCAAPCRSAIAVALLAWRGVMPRFQRAAGRTHRPRQRRQGSAASRNRNRPKPIRSSDRCFSRCPLRRSCVGYRTDEPAASWLLIIPSRGVRTIRSGIRGLQEATCLCMAIRRCSAGPVLTASRATGAGSADLRNGPRA